MSAPAVAVATAIDSAVAELTLGSNLFATIPARDPGRAVPQKCVFCLLTGGPIPTGYLDGNSGVQVRYPTVTITVRSAPHDFSGGQALARACKDAIHRATIAGYIGAAIRQSEPIYLGQETNGSFTWSMDADLIVEE